MTPTSPDSTSTSETKGTTAAKPGSRPKASREAKKRAEETKKRGRGLGGIRLFVAPLLMAVFGAYLAITTTGDAKDAYLERLVGGLVFAIIPIFAAIVLVVAFQLIRRLFRS